MITRVKIYRTKWEKKIIARYTSDGGFISRTIKNFKN